MDQLTEFLNYRKLFSKSNLTNYFSPTFNFTDVDSIIENFKKDMFPIQEYSTVILLSMYAPIFLAGLIGNVLIIISSIREKSLKKSKHFLLVNLACADLAVTLFCMPASVGTIIYRPWIYGRFLCKFVAFMQGVAVAVSIFSLTAMSVDRYLSIQHPAQSRKVITAAQAVGMLAAIWLVSLIFMAPLLYIRDLDTLPRFPEMPEIQFCIEMWPQDRDKHAYGLFLLFVVFLIPGATLTICYGHLGRALCVNDVQRQSSDSSTRGLFSRKKAARMLIILVVVFMICWLPYNIASLMSDLGGDNILMILFFTLWLGHAHSALNPIMYWVLNRQFRHRVRGMVKWVQAYSCTSTLTRNGIPEYV
ncbi:hypothetical protein FSP39_024340 [Pinctada imbricata]|uniref:G-protein coupled receptors family 1 profile domain-containing protein n=1 Tax=Pinctada imbricata TaxID=66713 RepID=A0AA88Y620_PINIB|nr:hypothetical protein FSP39_024340 [Pinctada imbricata]